MLPNCQNSSLFRKSWSPRIILVTDLWTPSRLVWFCACADSCVVFITVSCISLTDNSTCLYRGAIKVVQWTGKSGSGISNICEKFVPIHMSRDTAHVQWYERSVNGMGDVITHNSRTDRRRIFELRGQVDHVTPMYNHWPKSKGQRSRSQGHVTCQQ